MPPKKTSKKSVEKTSDAQAPTVMVEKSHDNSNGDVLEKKKAEFEMLAQKFEHMEDMVNRYIARQEMNELKEWLADHGVNVEVP
jgi:hypothetical protein